MAEVKAKRPARRYRFRHRGRIGQVGIYFGKMLRMFLYQNDWKVLPMAALIAGLVGMVIRRRFLVTMEGTLMGSFALVCVCIWNGGFNSIQVICRERDVIKREHRSGMHISSYVFSHMLYQALLCLLQTGITLYVLRILEVSFPFEGMFTRWFVVDLGISMFLITYASDMLSLWVSSLSRTTTTAMTIMPFVLIFQLVFSGGMLDLPAWTQPLTGFTISNPGLKVIAAQADTNNRPFTTISSMIGKMRDSEITFDVSLGQVLGALSDDGNPSVAKVRQTQLGRDLTVAELKEIIEGSGTVAAHRDDLVTDGLTLGDALKLLDASGAWDAYADRTIEASVTVGQVVDWLASAPELEQVREEQHTVDTTLGSVLDIVGEEKVRGFIEGKAAEASFVADYTCSKENIVVHWLHIAAFILLFAALATITLEFIDKDKR